MTEKESTFGKLIKGSLLDKIVVIVSIFTFIVIILGVSDVHINRTLYSISLIVFIILTFFIVPLRSFESNNEDRLFGLEELVIFVFHGINVLVFCSTLYIIFLSDNCQLNLSYWIFTLSLLFLVAFFVFTKFRKKKDDEDCIREGRGTKIANRVFLIISLLLLFKNTVLLIFYTVTTEEYLKEIEKPQEIYVYTIEKETHKKKYDSKIEIEDRELIDEIIDQINHNEIKSINGFEALNYMKRSIILPHHEVSHFENREFDGFLNLQIFEDGNIVMRKLWFGSFWVSRYETYYKVELLPETVEKINAIIKKKQD